MSTPRQITRQATRGQVWMHMDDKGRKRLATLMCIQERTHRDVSHAAGWKSHGMVGHLLAGRKDGVTMEAALRIARYFGVPVHELFVTKLSSAETREAA